MATDESGGEDEAKIRYDRARQEKATKQKKFQEKAAGAKQQGRGRKKGDRAGQVMGQAGRKNATKLDSDVDIIRKYQEAMVDIDQEIRDQQDTYHQDLKAAPSSGRNRKVHKNAGRRRLVSSSMRTKSIAYSEQTRLRGDGVQSGHRAENYDGYEDDNEGNRFVVDDDEEVEADEATSGDEVGLSPGEDESGESDDELVEFENEDED